MKNQIDSISEEDVFTCPETRERIRRNVYELRLGMLVNIYQQKIQEVINAIPFNLRNTKIAIGQTSVYHEHNMSP